MFFERLVISQINIDSIDKNYVACFPKERLLKLNVSNVKEDKIEEGIREVIEEVKQSERLDFQFKKNNTNKEVYCERKIITLFVCIAIGIGAMVVIKYYIDDDRLHSSCKIFKRYYRRSK